MANSETILLTGGTGFIGFRTLLVALKRGFSVRVATRDDANIDDVRNHPDLQELSLPLDERLSFAIVPDITAEGAFKDAIKGVQYAIHIASPIPQQNVNGHKDAERVFLRPARNGVLEVLKAAQNESGIRKVVVTSSTVALMPGKIWGGIDSSKKKYDGSARTPTPEPPFDTAAQAYWASKISALNATDEWVSTNRPAFDVVNVCPPWVLGPSSFVKSRKEFENGTNRYIVGVATGRVQELVGDRKLIGASVHVDDLALIHVLAIQKDVKGYKTLIASSSMTWQDITDLVQQYAPEAVKEGLFSVDAKQSSIPIDIDGSETESLFGITFRPFSEQVKDALQQYALLPESA